MAARKKAAGSQVAGAKAAKTAKPASKAAPAPETPAPAKTLCSPLAKKRKLAKDAMWVSLAVLTATAFTGAHKRGVSRSLHIASGAALIGLTLWHHSLYNRKKAEQCPEPR